MGTLPQSLRPGAPLVPSQAHDTAEVVEVDRRRGRPSRSAPTSGQMTLTGEVVEVVEVVEPDRRRSPWTEPTPEPLTEADDLEVVAEAATEALALDAELAELTPGADQHLFSRSLTRGVMRTLADEPPRVRLALVAHLLAMGYADSHAWSLTRLAEDLGGCGRNSMTKGTARLVDLGLLARRERGGISPTQTRPAEYRKTEYLRSLTCNTVAETVASASKARASDEFPTDSSETVAGAPEARASAGAPEARAIESFRELPTTRESSDKAPSPPDYLAAGSACIDCGGAVKTNPNKPSTPPNPRCKPCHDQHKRPSGRSWDHTSAPDYQYNPYGTPSR